MGDDVDISMLTIKQYLALIQDNNRLGIVKPEISNDVKFKINSSFMRELRRKLLKSIFYYPQGVGLEVEKRLLAGVINTWDLLEKEFIWKYCSPFKIAKKLKEIRNLKQEIDETLYHAWERYSDLLYRCLQHDLNCQQKVHIFYTGLDISTRRMLDSRGFITLITPTQALISIQVMADQSHNCFKEAHPTKECPLKKEDKAVEQSEKVKVRTTISKESVKEPVPRDLRVVQTYAPPTLFLGHLKGQMGSPYRTHKIVCTIGIPKEVHKLKAQKDEGYIDVGWDIIVEDVERIRHLLTPTIHTLPNLEYVVQPYMSLGPVHDKEKIIREEEQDYD
ncbi:ribonuclease H-like domain-containing protein, partial [Tanacetum coccineum]